ncbi:cytochrome c553 [Thiogranum longum]|uniref:Cytochrome c553 n=1 Tax=Thiogranum longum TaxID=1537524 RepID=A0A4R1HB75_9GAMM|nr:cytochrome c [Thiogranum longum]TCK19197.1 cytochrome c553 [Thiogranum longum]
MKRLIPIVAYTFFSAMALNAQAGGHADAGKTIAAQQCASCHAADGNSTDPQFPRLAGQWADYIERALLDYKSGARSNPIMSGFAAGLSRQNMKDVGAWFASQPGVFTPVQPKTVQE